MISCTVFFHTVVQCADVNATDESIYLGIVWCRCFSKAISDVMSTNCRSGKTGWNEGLDSEKASLMSCLQIVGMGCLSSTLLCPGYKHVISMQEWRTVLSAVYLREVLRPLLVVLYYQHPAPVHIFFVICGQYYSM